VHDRRLLSKIQEERFRRIVVGEPWLAIFRKGKYLGVRLGNQWEIIFHLRMNRPIGAHDAQGETFKQVLPDVSGIRSRGRSCVYDQRRFGEVFLKGPQANWPGKRP